MVDVDDEDGGGDGGGNADGGGGVVDYDDDDGGGGVDDDDNGAGCGGNSAAADGGGSYNDAVVGSLGSSSDSYGVLMTMLTVVMVVVMLLMMSVVVILIMLTVVVVAGKLITMMRFVNEVLLCPALYSTLYMFFPRREECVWVLPILLTVWTAPDLKDAEYTSSLCVHRKQLSCLPLQLLARCNFRLNTVKLCVLVQFSLRLYLYARKNPYALHPVSEVFLTLPLKRFQCSSD